MKLFGLIERGASKNYFSRKHDIILCYGKTDQKDSKTQKDPATKTKFNATKEKSYLTGQLKHSAKNETLEDEWGKYQMIRFSQTDIKLYKDERGYFTLVNSRDAWWDIDALGRTSKERKYATQKPLTLLKRIIEASTNEGDVVLDPFCGCGTAIVAAHQLKRTFVGIDISLYASTTLTHDRLVNEAKMKEEEIRVSGIPMDHRSAIRLAKDEPFEFERFAVQACHPGLVPNLKQRGDKGIDGRGYLLEAVKENGEKKTKIICQVKAGKPSIDHVKAFAHVIEHTEGVIAGVFVTAEKCWTDGMREVARELGTFKHEHSLDEFPKLQFWHVGQFFFKHERQRLPKLPEMADPSNRKEKVSIRQIGFLAKRYGK